MRPQFPHFPRQYLSVNYSHSRLSKAEMPLKSSIKFWQHTHIKSWRVSIKFCQHSGKSPIEIHMSQQMVRVVRCFHGLIDSKTGAPKTLVVVWCNYLSAIRFRVACEWLWAEVRFSDVVVYFLNIKVQRITQLFQSSTKIFTKFSSKKKNSLINRLFTMKDLLSTNKYGRVGQNNEDDNNAGDYDSKTAFPLGNRTGIISVANASADLVLILIILVRG